MFLCKYYYFNVLTFQSESSQSSDDEENSSEPEEEPSKPVEKEQISKTKTRAKPKDSEYFITPDNYFMMHSSKKVSENKERLNSEEHNLKYNKTFPLLPMA